MKQYSEKWNFFCIWWCRRAGGVSPRGRRIRSTAGLIDFVCHCVTLFMQSSRCTHIMTFNRGTYESHCQDSYNAGVIYGALPGLLSIVNAHNAQPYAVFLSHTGVRPAI